MSAAALFTVVGYFLYLVITENASRASDEAFDRVLGAAALSIADTVAYESGSVTVDIPYSAFAILGTSRLNRIFYRVVGPDGTVITGSPVLGLEIAPASGPELRLADSIMQGEAVRVAAIGRYRSDATTGEAGWIDVLVAETREARDQLAGQLAVNAALPAVAIALCAFLLIWIGIRFAFSPLRSVERSLRNRSPADLTPISGAVPREVEALVITLNEFMGRLGSTLDGLRRVTSDAAHQLRTPLAALRGQAEVALEETDAAQLHLRLSRIHENAVHASLVANQWLTDATLLHNIKSRQTEPVDLRGLVRAALDRIEAEGRFRNQALGLDLELGNTPVIVSAEPVSLIEMIRNLAENAFLYAPGPTLLRLDQNEGTARLAIIDTGPGIPRERRDAVFARFERNTDRVPGSGLGLSIARDVVEALGGTIALSDTPDGGLTVEVNLPLARADQPPPIARRQRGARRKLPPVVVAVLALGAGLAGLGGDPHARAQSAAAASIMSTVSPERFGPVLDELALAFPAATLVYSQARSPQIAAIVRARTGDEPAIIILPAPDIAVSLTNDGLAAPLNIALPSTGSGSERHWRGELYVLGYDPAVFAYNIGAFEQAQPPQSRLELVQLLEQTPTPLARRIGIVNVGIDSVSYTLAAQDSLRSPLFWRLARALGAAQARIYDNAEELLSALAAGEIDIGYNVPLSAIAASGPDSGIGYLEPRDYVVSVPWTVFAPRAAFQSQNTALIEYLLEPASRPTGLRMLSLPDAGQVGLHPDHQRIELGPELLVFLDSIKRSRFLDTWFQLVTSP